MVFDRYKLLHLNQSGVTLVELLLAIAILGIIAVLGWKGLDSIIFSQRTLSEDVENIRNLQIVFAQLQTDCLKLAKPNRINGRSPLAINDNVLIISRESHLINGTPGVQIVKYYLEDEHLMRWASPTTRSIESLHRYFIQREANVSNPPISLLSSVDNIEINLWDQNLEQWEIADLSPLDSPEKNTKPSISAAQIWKPSWKGLSLAIKFTNRQSSITKIVALGP